ANPIFKPDWKYNVKICHTIALEVKEFLARNPEIGVEKTIGTQRSYSYTQELSLLSDDGYGFGDAGNHATKAKSLIEIIKKLSPFILMINDDAHRDRDGFLWPVLHIKIDSTKIEYTTKIDGNICIEKLYLHKLLKIPPETKSILTISATALQVLNS